MFKAKRQCLLLKASQIYDLNAPFTCHCLTTVPDVHELWTVGLPFTAKKCSLICKFIRHSLWKEYVCVPSSLLIISYTKDSIENIQK